MRTLNLGAILFLGILLFVCFGQTAELPIEAARSKCGADLRCRVEVLGELGDESQGARYLREIIEE